MSWVPSVQTSHPSNDRGSFQGARDGGDSGSHQGRSFQNQACKVYIQNIPMDMQQDAVEALFSKWGQVVHTKLLEPKGGRNTMCGFITFSSEDAVEETIQKMNGCSIGDGPPLRVMKPKSNNQQSSGESGGKSCFKCGESGHFSRECPNNTEQNDRSGGGRTCYKCGEAGHFSRECPNNTEQNDRSGGGRTCFKCGEAGHFSRECPNNTEQRNNSNMFNNSGQQFNSRSDFNKQQSPLSFNNNNYNTNNNGQSQNPGFRNHQSNSPRTVNNQTNGSVNFMAMLGRGESRNTSNPPGPGHNAPQQFPQQNGPQAMQNGYQHQNLQEQPGNQGYQQPYEDKPALEQAPSQVYQQQGNQQQGYNQQTQSYQEQNSYQQQQQPSWQGQPTNQGYQEGTSSQNYQQPSGPGSYQEQNYQYQQDNIQPESQGYQPNYQEPQQPPSQQFQQNYQDQQQPTAPQNYQEPQQPPSQQFQQNYQEPQQPPSQQFQQNYQEPQQQTYQNQQGYYQQEQATPQPAYNDQPPNQFYQQADNSQGFQATSTPTSNSWGDRMADSTGNTQGQSSWMPNASSSSGGRQSGGDRVCRNCNEPGHFQRECPNPRQQGSQTCHRCGESGHFARECPQSQDSRSCHRCGEVGHFSRECPNKSGPGNDQLCHRCGGSGHFARDCNQLPNNRGGPTCHCCGKEGHISRECPESSSRGGSGCHKCGEEGHFARECPNAEVDPSRPPPVTYIPEEPEDIETLFKDVPHSGINFEKYDQIQVKVSGLNEAPQHINSFNDVNFGPQCQANIRRAGFVKPTPVQKYTFPIVLGGFDVMACAQTGSGKTVAYLLPTLTNLISKGLPGASRSPLALCLAPTRELVRQIYQEARKFSDGTPVRVCEVYGGVSVSYQAQLLEQGCHFLAATPGRLLDFISRERIFLDNIQYLILDEADRMLDMGFEQDVRKIVERSNMSDKFHRQTLMFSATFPDDIQRLAGDFLKNDYMFLAVGRVGGTNLDIEQTVVQANGNDKRDKLFDILNSTGKDRTLVFVELKRVADFLACLLSENNFPTTSISSDRNQREREEALRDFRNGRAYVLVATSVAARGLDIPDVKHVINYDLPKEIDEYVHRIGRTGRIGNQGKATSFFEQGRDDKLARSLVKVLSDAHQEVPSWLEQAAEDAVGSGYGPAGGRFASRDHREGGRGRERQNGYQSANLENNPSSQFGSQSSYKTQSGPSQSYSGPSYNSGGAGSGSYNGGGVGTGPSYNTGGAGSGLAGGAGSGPSYNVGGGVTGDSDDDWD